MLRDWQREAIEKYEAEQPRDFLLTATPGAGKTTFALTLAQRLLARRVIDRVIVVAPTDHLRTQWADSSAALEMRLDPNLPNSVGPLRPDTIGYVTTYAQVSAKPMLHRRRTEAKRTLVIFDEIHHAGDALSWGEAVKEAFEPAPRRLCLTGTPFRTKPTERIPFVRYVAGDPGELLSTADYTYGYREALADGVVRPVVFAAYAGTSRWLNSAGEVLAATLGEPSTKAVEDAAWRTALDAGGDWVPHVIAAVDERVSQLRANGVPDAAGLILASDQQAARAYAAIATRVTGVKPVLILSEDARASKKIAEFGSGNARLAICVRMVSEGVDIPRAAVLGYLTAYRTPLFFAQAVGRVVRARGRHETATVFLPAVRPLLGLAADMEEERDHVVSIRGPVSDDMDALGALDDMTASQRVQSEPGEGSFTALEAQAQFAHVLHAGRAILADEQRPSHERSRDEITDETHDLLGLPGLLSPEQTATVLAARDADLRRKSSRLASPVTVLAAPSGEGPAGSATDWRDAEELRREVHALVGQVAGRTQRLHSQVHAELREQVPGPPAAQASAEVLVERRNFLLARLHLTR